jgi:hypothetical protein
VRYLARWLALGGEFFHFECLGTSVTGGPPEWVISRRGQLIGSMPWTKYESFKEFERRASRRLRELLASSLEPLFPGH